ncbi:MAG: Gfo/Idh/MocA family oxidoreductase [Piscinibacter sp.]
MARRLKVALIGLGNAVEPHAKSLMDLADRVEVRAAVSRSPERLQAFSARFPFPTSTDLDAVFADPEVDAVWVLTPPDTHLAFGTRAAAAGKHVLMEKPLDINVAGGARLVEAFARADLRLGVALQHRFRPASLRVRALMDQGALGTIASAWMTVPWWRPQAYYDQPGRCTMARDGGGVLMTQAIHTLDLFRSLVGIREVVAADAVTTPVHRVETEDYAAALIRLGNGAPGVVMATTAAYPGGEERIEIMGSAGTAWMSGGNLAVRWHDGREEKVTQEGATGGGANPMDFPHDWHRSLITDFLDAIEARRDPAVSGAEALRSQEVIEAILAKAGWRPASP